MQEAEFQGFPKIPRLNRPVIVTEKIDGTNAQVNVLDDGRVIAGSKNRFLSVGKTTDNYGFAAWVQANEDALRDQLGIGQHFGEWYGQGIGRGYGLTERRFALFNVSRWTSGWNEYIRDEAHPTTDLSTKLKGSEILHVVPVLADFEEPSTLLYNNLITVLRDIGSMAVPGFKQAEGIVVYHTAGGALYKATLENDESHKEAR